MKHGKRYRQLHEQIDRMREYEPAEAISTVRSMQTAKFTEAVEAHIRLGVNVRHADQQVRGTMVLPNGSAATSRWRSSPRATRPERRRPPAPTPSAVKTSRSGSAAAGPTSTSRSRRPT